MAITTVTGSGHLSGGQYKRAYLASGVGGDEGAFGAANAMLKEWYLRGVQDVLNSKRPLTRIIRRNTEEIGGKYALKALNVQRNNAAQHISEGAPLPDPQTQGYLKTEWWLKNNYTRILLTGQAASASRNSRGAFLALLDGEMQGALRDIQHTENRVFFGDGSGRLAQVSAASGAAANEVLTLINPGGIVSQALGTQYLEVGMRIVIMASGTEAGSPVGTAISSDFRSDGTKRVYTITAIDAGAGTITIDNSGGASNAAANDYIYLCSSTGVGNLPLDVHTNRGHEKNGLAAIISDANPGLQRSGDPSAGLGNVLVAAAAAAGRWQSPIVDNAGVPIPFAESMFAQAEDLLDQAGDGVVDLWVTTHGIRRQWAFQLAQGKRFVNTVEMPGGYKALSYNDIPVMVDKDCTRGRIYGLDTSQLVLLYEADWNWLQDSQGSVLRLLDDYDAYQAALGQYAELMCRGRNRFVGIFDIQDA